MQKSKVSVSNTFILLEGTCKELRIQIQAKHIACIASGVKYRRHSAADRNILQSSRGSRGTSPLQPCPDTPPLGSHTPGTWGFVNHSRHGGWFGIPSAWIPLHHALPNREEREGKGEDKGKEAGGIGRGRLEKMWASVGGKN